MQITVENTGALERRMAVQVPAERVADAIDQRLKSLSRTVRLKGFRPGKVPVNVVKQQYGDAVRQEVIEKLLQSSFSEAVAEQNLTPAGGPRIEAFSAEEGQDMTFRAVFEVYPEFQLASVEALEVNRPTAEIAESDIDAMIDKLRTQQATYSKIERAAKDTDRVNISFVGTVDGEEFKGGKGDNFPVIVGGGRMLPEFEAGLVGMSVGETKVVDVNFPADYGVPELSGKLAKFSITAHNVEERVLPEVNDELAKSFGVEEGGLARLREEVKENMQREMSDAVRSRLRQQLFDGLVNANSAIELPSILIQNAMRDIQVEFGRSRGVRDAAQLPPAEQFLEPARRRVALGLLLGEVIKISGVTVDRGRVQSKLQDMVMQYPDPARAMKALRDNPESQRQLESMVLEDQVIDWMLEKVKINDQPISFKELMGLGN
ncbi:MAG TPA: trigger factor [Steroidobacteraceae bacterium]|nr:trigger factor [Steroidobacteraceae bacterium]